MPNKATEISLEKGIQIMDLLANKKITLNDKVAIISLLSNLEPEFIHKMNKEDIEKIYNKIEITKEKFQVIFPISFKLKKKLFGLVDFNKITVREWTEIEFFSEEGENPFTNIGEIMSVCFRPIKSKNKSLNHILINIILTFKFKNLVPKHFKSFTIEKYNDEHLKNKDLFLKHCDFGLGFGLINEIYKFKNQLKEEYKLLFKTQEQTEEEPEQNQLEFAEIWGTYHVINEISQNIFERDAWYERPLKEFYKYIAYRKQKTLYELRNGERK